MQHKQKSRGQTRVMILTAETEQKLARGDFVSSSNSHSTDDGDDCDYDFDGDQ